MKKRLKLILFLLSALVATINADESLQDKFREGTALYTAGKYTEALDAWLTVYRSGMISPELEYNIGNAFFKLNDIPHSILFYERALLLKPADEDIQYNLDVARTFVVDKFTAVPELFFITWYNFISLSISSDAWASLSLAAFVIFLLLLSFYLFTGRYRLKVAAFWLALFMLLISFSSLSFSLRNRNLVFNSGRAIIVSPQVNGKSSPDNSGTDLFLIHEGTKVTITDTLGEWNEIRLPDGNKGWIPSESLEKI